MYKNKYCSMLCEKEYLEKKKNDERSLNTMQQLQQSKNPVGENKP
jgi:hypothetical protein